MSDICPECGSSDWRSQASAVRSGTLKLEQLGGPIDRLAAYRSWRYRANIPYVNDVPDQIEYTYSGRPVACLEVTLCDLAPGYSSIPNGYLKAVWSRMANRDKTQIRSLTQIAEALQSPAYVVVHTSDMTEIHVRRTTEETWTRYDGDSYRGFLMDMRREIPRRTVK